MMALDLEVDIEWACLNNACPEAERGLVKLCCCSHGSGHFLGSASLKVQDVR